MINELLQAAQTEVDNHSIYVWGGSGLRDAGISVGALARESQEGPGGLNEVTHMVQKDEQGNIVLVPVEAQE